MSLQRASLRPQDNPVLFPHSFISFFIHLGQEIPKFLHSWAPKISSNFVHRALGQKIRIYI